MYKLEYFAKENALFSRDFKNKPQIEYVNLDHLTSFSSLKKFNCPFSNVYIDDYTIVSMKSGDKFYINEIQYNKLKDSFHIQV